MSSPVSGEQHERAVEAAFAANGHRGREVVMQGRIIAAIDAYHRSLAEQGVRLVDLREVVAWTREETQWYASLGGSKEKREGYALGLYEAGDALERRFGGHEGSE